MSAFVETNGFFWLQGTDLSQYTRNVTINYGSETQDKTTYGNTTRIFAPGLKTWTVDVDQVWDNTTAGPENKIWPLNGTTACWEFRPLNACTTVSNPSYSGIGVVMGPNQPGRVGDLLALTFSIAASGTLSRASSS